MEAVELLKELIRTPSFSKEEAATAKLISAFFERKGIVVNRHGNNRWVTTPNYRDGLPTVLLNSHHDTVKPVSGWTRDPFSPEIEDGKLYGLGSNDAGASLVSLAATFLNFYGRNDLPFNLIFLASAEEEISGAGGVASVLPRLGKIDFGIVGEPTEMQMAIAEKGLVVIDGLTTGKAGHAARDEGENALYLALDDIDKLRSFSFPKISGQLGKVKLSVTQIEAGTQHNVVPDSCRFVVDVRTTEQYSNQEVVEKLQSLVSSRLNPRSLRLNSSGISPEHSLVKAGLGLGRTIFGSSTLSDQALMPFPTLKMGPGHSNRSHTANEFIYLKEIEEGIDLYSRLLDSYLQKQNL